MAAVTERPALLGPGELAELGPPEAVRLPLDLVDPNPRNPRKDLLEIDALAENIRTFGLLQPVTVRRRDDRYELLGGHRRLAAFQLLREHEPHEAKWRTIPAVVRHEGDDDTALRMLISGQVHISNWKPREEARVLERLIEGGHNFTEVGEILHKTRSWASKRLRVYTDSVLSGYVQSGRLAPGIAEELLPVLDLETKQRLAEQAVKEHWSQDQIKGRVRALRLDRQLSQVTRLTHQLLDLLSSVNPRDVPIEATRDLWVIHGRIEVLARGVERRIPTVEEAQKAAGVKSQDKPLKRGERRRPGYVPKK